MWYNGDMPIINVKPEGADGAYTPYGGCHEFLVNKDHQVFLYGSAGSGKTTAMCYKMLLLCLKYPGCKFLFTRKSYKALIKSGVETFERVARECGFRITSKKDSKTAIRKIGESMPTEFQFPYAKRVDNEGRVWEGQSRILLASLDRVKDELGAEYDYIYVNQPEQVDEEDWGFLTTRADGRRGCSPYPQLMGDPNPEDEKHWIKKGGYELMDGEDPKDARWTLIRSTYRDNPVLWDQKEQKFTERGLEQIGRLQQSLNPVMAKRLIDGEWASYEGLVFGPVWDRSVHIIKQKDVHIDETWDRYWAFDFGFRDPFVFSQWVKDPQSEFYIRNKAIYMTNKTIYDHIDVINRVTFGEPKPVLAVADRNPESITILSRELGINIISAKKGAGSIKSGINILTEMLKQNKIAIMEDAIVEIDPRLEDAKLPIGFEQEVEAYRWNQNKQDEPVDKDNHEIDAAAYLFTHIKSHIQKVKFIWI